MIAAFMLALSIYDNFIEKKNPLSNIKWNSPIVKEKEKRKNENMRTDDTEGRPLLGQLGGWPV